MFSCVFLSPPDTGITLASRDEIRICLRISAYSSGDFVSLAFSGYYQDFEERQDPARIQTKIKMNLNSTCNSSIYPLIPT
jgi:hypothetical protein